MTDQPSFLYALVNPGFESHLKEEVQSRTPEVHPSFSRQGFVTFKAPHGFRLPRWTFARIMGRQLGKGSQVDLERFLGQSENQGIVHRTSLEPLSASGPEAPRGSSVIDVVEVDRGHFWWGRRTVRAFDWGTAGGLSPAMLPDDAPSRAWLKAEEMIRWTGWTPGPANSLLELGSAPGGATWSFLQRGASIVGVDLAPMDPRCLAHPRYVHRTMSIRDLRKKDLPSFLDTLVCDVSLKPVEAVPQICHWLQLFPSIVRVFYTLKLGDRLRTSDLDRFRGRLADLGCRVVSTQLPSNRSEIFVYADRGPSHGPDRRGRAHASEDA